ncbi:exopolysaccharide Pel transporter PelG [Lachnospiraceae bacterium ZAX-1]
MAGIGFELNKLIRRRGIVSCVSFYGVAAVVYTGPMLLGFCMLYMISFMASLFHVPPSEKELVIVVISYSLIASNILNSLLSLVTTRYTADMIYTDRMDKILPSMYGSIGIQLLLGIPTYGVFVFFSGAGLVLGIMAFALFCELTVVWTLVTYITAVKDYKRILMIFAFGTILSVLAGFVMITLKIYIVYAMIGAVYIGYGVILAGAYNVVRQYFPNRMDGCFQFLSRLKDYPTLLFIGILSSIGLFSHMIFVWYSIYGKTVLGLFRSSPQYDIPALFAFVSMLMTTVNFSATAEVNFYPAYKDYFDLLSGNGTIRQINTAEDKMIITLERELVYLAMKQFVFTMIAIALGGIGFHRFGLVDFNKTETEIFYTLCVAYGFYAVANSITMFLLYFSDYRDALIANLLFASVTVIGVILTRENLTYLGYGFVVGAAAMFLASALLLWKYLSKIRYHVMLKSVTSNSLE